MVSQTMECALWRPVTGTGECGNAAGSVVDSLSNAWMIEGRVW